MKVFAISCESFDLFLQYGLQTNALLSSKKTEIRAYSDARRSPRCSNFSMKSDFPMKGKRLQLIPANYDIKLASQNTVSSNVTFYKKQIQ